ncbi:MAG: GAF domain-containing protein [Myxococcota bacterium]
MADESSLTLVQRGLDAAQELVAENEKLLRQIEELKNASNASDSEYLQGLEKSNRELAEKREQIRKENAQLVNLYVAISQLHSSLEIPRILEVIVDIVIDLIGTKKLAVFAFDETTQQLEAIVAKGTTTDKLPKYELGEGVIGSSLADGELKVCLDRKRDSDRPIVCIPLSLRDRRHICVIAIYELVEQKDEFTSEDHEIFALLAEHAATALFSAQLYSQSKRKLDLFQGLCELLTDPTDTGK